MLIKKIHIYPICIFAVQLLLSINPNRIFAQCSLPGGAIALTNSYHSASIPAGSTYYVATGTVLKLDYSGVGNLTINGTIIIQSTATLKLKMGNNNLTINGTIQVCSSSLFEIDTAHDLTMNNSAALINIGIAATVQFCHFGHDFNPSAGTIAMNDLSSFEMIDYHSFNNADNNIFVYTGTGTKSIGTGNPIVHFGFSGAPGYPDQNTAASNYTASNHIDIVNDDFGTDKPGSGNYCGPQAFTNHLPCRSQWTGLSTSCFAAEIYQQGIIILPLNVIDISGNNNNGRNVLRCNIDVNRKIFQMIIERSSDENRFETLQTINIASQSQLKNYQFIDEQPLIGNNYYRIALIDVSGILSYSKIINVNNSELIGSSIKLIYPNPFTDNITFVFNSGDNQTISASIWDINGKKLQTKSFLMRLGENKIFFSDLNSLNKGVYIMKIQNKNEININYKIVKL